MKRYHKYFEPIRGGASFTRILSEDTMIHEAKEVAAAHGHTYPNDQEALLDFMAVNWTVPHNH